MRAAVLELWAMEYAELDEKRLKLEKECREIKHSLDELKEKIQEMVGVAEELNIPMVVTIGDYCVAQTFWTIGS